MTLSQSTKIDDWYRDNDIDESHKHTTEWKKENMKEFKLYDSICIGQEQAK